MDCGDFDTCFPDRNEYCDELIGECRKCEDLCSHGNLSARAELRSKCKQKCSAYAKTLGIEIAQDTSEAATTVSHTTPSKSLPAKTPKTRDYSGKTLATWSHYTTSIQSKERVVTRSHTFPQAYLKQYTSLNPFVVTKKNVTQSHIDELLWRQKQLEYLAMSTLALLMLLVLARLCLACYRRSRRSRRTWHINKDTNLRSVPPRHVYEMVPAVPNNYAAYMTRAWQGCRGDVGRSSEASPHGSFSSDYREPGQSTEFNGRGANLGPLRLSPSNNKAGKARTPHAAPPLGQGDYDGVVGHLSDNSTSARSSPPIHQENSNMVLDSLPVSSSVDTGVSCDGSQETTLLRQMLEPKQNDINEYKVSVI